MYSLQHDPTSILTLSIAMSEFQLLPRTASNPNWNKDTIEKQTHGIHQSSINEETY